MKELTEKTSYMAAQRGYRGEMRQRNGFVGRDIVEWVTSDVNRLVEGLKGEKEVK